MNLTPWRLWTLDDKPNTYTEEVVRVLEGVLERDPNHIGANHYYIHAMEASPWPARALTSAQRLGGLVPAAGHLVHMPAHIYMRTGDYEASVEANRRAVAADQMFLRESGTKGVYQVYYGHNLDFLSASYSMQGRYTDAYRASVDCREVIGPFVEALPFFESVLSYPLMVQSRFHRWDDLLNQPAPDPKFKTATNLWRYTRASALVGKGRIPEAEKVRDEFVAGLKDIPEDQKYGQNPERAIMQLAAATLEARIAAAKGDLPGAIQQMQEGVKSEDGLHYNEPPDWYYPPSREALGGALLQAGRYEEAEQVFRADLLKNRRNPRSLFGLWSALEAQGKKADAALVEPLYRTAWSRAEKPLTVKDLF
jgi:tetratricopeptide (TPR) repeat protein